MTRLSLEEEDIRSHISVDLSAVGLSIFIPSLVLTAYALSNVNNQIDSWEGNNDTKTSFLIANMEVTILFPN